MEKFAGFRMLAVNFLICMIISLVALPLAVGQEQGKSINGKQVFEQKCYKCHKPEKFQSQHHDLAGWEQILRRMELNTCVLSDDEASAVAVYLAKEHGE